MNFQGINLTIPHKVAILPLLDQVAPDAALIGAANTVRRAGDRLIGENTDGKGSCARYAMMPAWTRRKSASFSWARAARRGP